MNLREAIMMKIIRVKDEIEGGQEALALFKDQVKQGAHVFGLATGSTPNTTYQALCQSDLDFSEAISINLDEYVGLSHNDPQSYYSYMVEHLFKQKPFKHSYLPDGTNEDADEECQRYSRIIAQNPVDFQLLGIGRNGHIGFNEPGSPFDGTTRKIKLTESTLNANARFFANEADVPRYAYSMGIGEIMQAKTILLEAYGMNKADAIQKTIEGPVTPNVPASILQKHPNVYFILDEEAASKLSK